MKSENINVQGYLNIVHDGMYEKRNWEIDCSDVLSRLIKEAGTICESNAHTLFQLWNRIDEIINAGKLANEKMIFAFCTNGVLETASFNDPEVRTIWQLTVITNGGVIKMSLKKLEKYFFTFGSDPGFPFQYGYILIIAENIQKAIEKFREKYPDRSGNDCINCAFYYSESEWNTIKCHGMSKCHEILL